MQIKNNSRQQRRYMNLINFSGKHKRQQAAAFTLAVLLCCAVTIAVRAYHRPTVNSIASIKDVQATPGAETALPLPVTQPEPGVALAPVNSSAAKAESPEPATLFQGFIQGQRPTGLYEVHLVTLTPEGFEPEAMSLRQGHFILAYENRSGNSSITVQFADEPGLSIHQKQMPRLISNWLGEFNLQPGKYFLKESSHPDWNCTITITN